MCVMYMCVQYVYASGVNHTYQNWTFCKPPNYISLNQVKHMAPAVE